MSPLASTSNKAPVSFSQSPVIMSCWWVAKPLLWWSPPTPSATKIPEQSEERWHPHIHWRAPSSSVGIHGRVHTWGLEEETGQVWHGRFGQWSYLAHGTDHLPSRRHGQRAGWCSKPHYSPVCGSPMAASQWGPPAPSHPQGRGSPKGPCQTLCCLIPIQVWLKGMPDPMNYTSQWILAEIKRARSHPCWWKELRDSKKVHHGEWLQKNTPYGKTSANPKPCTMLDGRLHPSGCPSPNWRLSAGGMPHPGSAGCVLRISCPILMPLALGTLFCETRENPGLSLSIAVLHRKVRGADCSPL